MFRNTRGAISVILASTVSLLVLLILSVNIVESILHITARNSINNLIQVEANTIVKTKVINNDVYDFFNKDIAAYTDILKNYSTIYTVYELENGAIVEKSSIEATPDVNIQLKPGQIVKITVKQTDTSELQKITNLLQGTNEDSYMEIFAEGVVE